MVDRLQRINKLLAVLMVQKRLREADFLRCAAELQTSEMRRLSMLATLNDEAPNDLMLTLKLRRLVQLDLRFDEARRAYLAAQFNLARIQKQHEILVRRWRIEKSAINREAEMNDIADWLSNPLTCAADGESGAPKGE